MSATECDWGWCNNPATTRRYDPQFDQWLPCCSDCATKPYEKDPPREARRV